MKRDDRIKKLEKEIKKNEQELEKLLAEDKEIESLEIFVKTIEYEEYDYFFEDISVSRAPEEVRKKLKEAFELWIKILEKEE